MNASPRIRVMPLGLVTALVGLVGCSQNVSQQAWSTRGEGDVRPQPEVYNAPLGTPEPAISAGTMGNDRAAAIDILLQAADSSNPVLRANAIESLQVVPGKVEEPLRRALADENQGVRFVAAMTVGQLRLRRMAPLTEPLMYDSSESVRAAAMYALHRCGVAVDLTPLSEMLLSPDPEVRGNVAMILGELGDHSAAPMLQQAVGRKLNRVGPIRARIIELQMAEAMVKLGAEEELEVVRAALFAPSEHAEIAALACIICGSLKDGRSIPDLLNLAQIDGTGQRPDEVRMAAVYAIAQIAPSKAPIDIPMRFVESEDHRLRQQAALTLGQIGYQGSLPTVSRLMHDSNALVQVAAAKAVLQISR